LDILRLLLRFSFQSELSCPPLPPSTRALRLNRIPSSNHLLPPPLFQPNSKTRRSNPPPPLHLSSNLSTCNPPPLRPPLSARISPLLHLPTDFLLPPPPLPSKPNLFQLHLSTLDPPPSTPRTKSPLTSLTWHTSFELDPTLTEHFDERAEGPTSLGTSLRRRSRTR